MIKNCAWQQSRHITPNRDIKRKNEAAVGFKTEARADITCSMWTLDWRIESKTDSIRITFIRIKMISEKGSLEWFHLTRVTKSNSQCAIVRWIQKKIIEIRSTSVYVLDSYCSNIGYVAVSWGRSPKLTAIYPLYPISLLAEVTIRYNYLSTS